MSATAKLPTQTAAAISLKPDGKPTKSKIGRRSESTAKTMAAALALSANLVVEHLR